MIFYAVAFALLAHLVWWGAGFAMLVTPTRWRRFWPVLIAPAGLAAQSTVVWAGAYADLAGTNSYAWWSELLPLVLLAFGLRRVSWASAWSDMARFGLVWIVASVSLAVLVLPLALGGRGLTSVSLGSCDAADYAAGARVFMEFARSDREGFLGLTEVVRVMSTDNFFDFWLRLNHFTPSALMALNGSVLNCRPHELASVFTMLMLASTTPLVFWIARAVFGYSGAASLAIAALFGINPIPWYSVAHVSPAPLIAAQAIGLLNWAAIALWHGRLTWSRGLQYAGVLAIGYALVLGSYNFIVIICLVPALTYAAVGTLCTHDWIRFARWQAMVLSPLALSGAVYFARVAGLVERFVLFQTFDFGWRIPGLSPEGWLGLVQGGSLRAWVWADARWLLAAIVVGALAWAIAISLWARRRRVWIVASVTLPILAGYAFLLLRGARNHTNASYDAFKLFTVFYPLLLPAFCWWITLRWSTRLLRWVAVAGVSVVVVSFNLVACGMFIYQLSRAPLTVHGELRQMRRIEAMADVRSVNMLLPEMWPRLWANAFLIQKPQYFPTHTYEGRLNTELRGEWDLVSGVLRIELPDGAMRRITANYSLLDTRHPQFIRVWYGAGWHRAERLPNGERWRWTRGDAVVSIDNPHPYSLKVRMRLDGRAASAREVSIIVNGRAVSSKVRIGADRERTVLPTIDVPPGRSELVLHSDTPPERVADDSRPLSLCVYSLSFQPIDHITGRPTPD